MVGKEPAAVGGVLSALVVVGVSYGVLNQQQAGAWSGVVAAVVILLNVIWTRSQVMPVKTITDAGLNPEAVKANADNPSVKPFVE